MTAANFTQVSMVAWMLHAGFPLEPDYMLWYVTPSKSPSWCGSHYQEVCPHLCANFPCRECRQIRSCAPLTSPRAFTSISALMHDFSHYPTNTLHICVNVSTTNTCICYFRYAIVRHRTWQAPIPPSMVAISISARMYVCTQSACRCNTCGTERMPLWECL